ncbi:MAG: CvpA family protein [Buchnera aphidicola (Chaetogeoica yunlongensis)]
MNIIDYISITIVIFSAVMSFFKGFLQELSSILIWVLGIYLFCKYYNCFSIFSIYVRNLFLQYVVTFLVFFIFIVVIKSFSNYCISITIDQFGMSFLNKILGIFFGIFRGVLILCIIIFILRLFTNISDNYYFKNSFFIPYFNYFIKCIVKFFVKNIFFLKTKY